MFRYNVVLKFSEQSKVEHQVKQAEQFTRAICPFEELMVLSMPVL